MRRKKDTPYNSLPLLPPAAELETKQVLKKTISAHRALAELKGWSLNQPNPLLLLHSITLQEAKSSSEIENIVTTNDEIYQALAAPTDKSMSPAAKEVLHYKEALWRGFREVSGGSPLTINRFIDIFRIVKQRDDGIRSIPGTVLVNQRGEVVYTPPDNKDDILRLLSNLERYINMDCPDDPDPLVKLAVMHYQFECIHPFPDGNGRVGRILNVLYLVHAGLLKFPILYLSRYIIQRKGEYYRRLQAVTELQEWEGWVVYMLDAIETTAKESLRSIQSVSAAQADLLETLKSDAPELCSKELVELLFEQPYCKISFLVDRGIAKHQTSSKYLKRLCDLGAFRLVRRGRENYYINIPLWKILTGE